MEKGDFDATEVASVLVEADDSRHEVFLQHLSGGPVYLEFGDEDPVVGEGLVLWYEIPGIVIDDHRARLAIRGVCDPFDVASGSYSTC